MNQPTLQELIDAARAYEQLFVPALLREWAPRVAAAARIQPGDKVLDVACGTGVLAREASARAGASGAVVGLDVNPAMLAVAAEPSSAIEWRQAPAEALPFEDRSFDAVVSQFGLMFFSDREQALREMLRVLHSGGRMAVAVWDSLESAPAFAAEVDLFERMAGRPAADALRAPFLLGDRQGLVDLFAGAGVGSVSIATHPGRARFPSLRILVEADLRGWLPAMGVVLPEVLIQRILAEAERELASYVTSEGKIDFDVSAHIVSGRRSD
jgi:SAM-dependent methyltransferase